MAIFYADKLEDLPADADGNFLLINNAAEELRRLSRVNSDLLEALQAMIEIAELTIGFIDDTPFADVALIQSRAAIAKATGQ